MYQQYGRIKRNNELITLITALSEYTKPFGKTVNKVKDCAASKVLYMQDSNKCEDCVRFDTCNNVKAWEVCDYFRCSIE